MKSVSLSLLLLSVSCANPVTKAVKRTKYAAWETIGVQKRDLFKREVANVKEEEEDAGKAMQSVVDQLQELTGQEEGPTEREYRKLDAAYESAKSEAKEVSDRILAVDNVANDLFSEWKDELGQIQSSEYRRKSRRKLEETKTRYENLHGKLLRSEQKMEPVLARLKDQVIFLKHNLNAEALGGVEMESKRIQRDIDNLMVDMQKSIHEAQEFVKTL